MPVGFSLVCIYVVFMLGHLTCVENRVGTKYELSTWISCKDSRNSPSEKYYVRIFSNPFLKKHVVKYNLPVQYRTHFDDILCHRIGK